MKNKFLSFALLTAVAATFLVPSAVFADTNTASVSVSADTTFTMALTGQAKAPTFSVAAYSSQASHNKTWDASTGTDYITVVDYTGAQSGKDGHHINIALNRATWWYSGADAAKATRVGVFTGFTAIPNDKIRLYVRGGTTSYTFTAKDTNLCSAVGSTSIGNIVLSKTGTTSWATTSNTCPGTTVYKPVSAQLKVATNGLGNGSYTISGTVTLVDGQ